MKATPLCLLVLLGSPPAAAQDLKSFEKKVTEFTLPNGMHFIVAERHQAPVISFHTHVNAGSVDDPLGHTGLAHMFERMAYKGTDTIGTRDWAGEKKALDAIEDVYDQIDAERNKGSRADSGKLDQLRLRFQAAVEAAEAFVVPNETARVLEQNGGTGLNATTSTDATEFRYSLPSNRMELWFLLESQRLAHPVFRQFYLEREAMLQEQRLRVDSNPQGRLLQEFQAASFEAHPYRNPPLGWLGDVPSLRATDARAFFEKYYAPGNITVAIVGDADPAEVRKMADRYFAPIPARPLPPRILTTEPAQVGDRTVVVEAVSQPMLAVGYQRPDQYSPDDEAFDVLQLIFASGRTGLVYKDLVQERKLAVNALVSATYPAGRYPNEFVFLLMPALNHTVEENQRALDALLLKFVATPVDAETLDRAKTKARSSVIHSLGDNAGLAGLMATYAADYGDWRHLFTAIDQLSKVSAADVQRVATKYLIGRPRTVAYIKMRPQLSGHPGDLP